MNNGAWNVRAENDKEAERIATEDLHKKFPPVGGWAYAVSMSQVPDDWIITAYEELKATQ